MLRERINLHYSIHHLRCVIEQVYSSVTRSRELQPYSLFKLRLTPQTPLIEAAPKAEVYY